MTAFMAVQHDAAALWHPFTPVVSVLTSLLLCCAVMVSQCAGMGFVANSLRLGCDCLGHIKYFDGVVNNARVRGQAGNAALLCGGRIAVCLEAHPLLHVLPVVYSSAHVQPSRQLHQAAATQAQFVPVLS